MPPLLMPAVVFYSSKGGNIIGNSERSNHLKKSLSKALTLFYPLSGRLVGNSYVDCNDEGVTYVEAQANHTLLDVIRHPNVPNELNKFVPCEPDDGKDLCLVVQATFFSCGGMAIGLGISHKVVDGFSIAMFYNGWAAFSRGDDLIQSPIFESAILFPPNDSFGELVALGKKQEMVSKLFVFSSEKIVDLRDKYTTNSEDTQGTAIRPSRIDALSAFIATRYIVATRGKDNHTGKVYGLRTAVDIRRRVIPPLSEYHFGNLFATLQITLPSRENYDEDGAAYGVLKTLRDAIQSVNGEDLFGTKNGPVEAEKIEPVYCNFSSLCSIPLHKADFGLGIPVWIVVGSVPLNNMTFFTNSLSGGGIDAIMNMKKEEMAKFEADEELLKYVSVGNEEKFLSEM